MTTYNEGDVAHLVGIFQTLRLNVDGTPAADAQGKPIYDPADPDTVELITEAPDGTRTTHTDVTRTSTGVYTFDLLLDQGGPQPWHYEWRGTGASAATDPGELRVRASRFPAD